MRLYSPYPSRRDAELNGRYFGQPVTDDEFEQLAQILRESEVPTRNDLDIEGSSKTENT